MKEEIKGLAGLLIPPSELSWLVHLNVSDSENQRQPAATVAKSCQTPVTSRSLILRLCTSIVVFFRLVLLFHFRSNYL